MYRSAIEKLKKWKKSYFRKPLIIEGARQVGKTWLMKEFGKECYKKTVYINFDSNRQMRELFSSDLNIERIIMGLEIYSESSDFTAFSNSFVLSCVSHNNISIGQQRSFEIIDN